jgi:hypothetical protein
VCVYQQAGQTAHRFAPTDPNAEYKQGPEMEGRNVEILKVITTIKNKYKLQESLYMKELDCWMSRRNFKAFKIYAARWLP